MNRNEFYQNEYSTLNEKTKLTPRLNRVLQIFSKYRFESVLDIGCGDGNFTKLIKNVCKLDKIYGVEISPEAVNIAQKNEVVAFQSDVGVDSLPFPNNFFDAIFCGEVIEHIFDPDAMLIDIKRVLRPDGLLIITTPNLASWFNRVILFFGFQPYYTDVSIKYCVGKLRPFAESGSGHIRVFTLRALKELLEVNDFIIIDIKGTCHYDAKPVSFILDITEKLMSHCPPLSSTIIVVAKNSK